MDRMIAAYMEDCEKDKGLKSFDEKWKTRFEAVMKTSEEGLGQLKESMSFVCEVNKGITDTIMSYEDEIVQFMAGDVEGYKIVRQYFDGTTEMLAFCTEVDWFVISARNSHSHIAHEIQKLQTDFGMETTDDVDDNGAVKGTVHYIVKMWKRNINIFYNYLAGNIISPRNRFRRIVEVLENLKGSEMVSCSDSAERLLLSIQALEKKFDDMFEALDRYTLKLQKKQKANRKWKRITNMIVIGTIVCAGVLSMLTVAGTKLIGRAVEKGKHWASSLYKQYEDKIRNRQGVVDSMKDGALIARKELEDFKHLIDMLLNPIDSFVKIGKFGMNHSDDDRDVSHAMNEIKKNLRIFLNRIEELDKERKNCDSEIKKARDVVLAKLTNKVEVVKDNKLRSL